MQATHSSSKALQVLAGFDDRTCRGSVLVWNNGSVATEALVTLSHVPFSSVSIEEWRIDDFHPLGVRPLPLHPSNHTAWTLAKLLPTAHHLSPYGPRLQGVCERSKSSPVTCGVTVQGPAAGSSVTQRFEHRMQLRRQTPLQNC